MNNTYFILAKFFLLLSLSAFGGGNVILPSIDRVAVTEYHWLTNQQFLDLFSISKAAPGPTTLIVELVAMRAVGFSTGVPASFLFFPALLGALIALVTMFVPSSLLLLFVARFWKKIQGMPWQITLQKALMPITAGLILASVLVVAKTAITNWITGVMGLLSFIIILRTKINPILIMGVAAFLSWLFAR